MYIEQSWEYPSWAWIELLHVYRLCVIDEDIESYALFIIS